ncbi:MAG: TrmH family RNA methyltransferase [Psychroserpens sp.]|uniref:TrmH family RNA methyltransferase n=1 Tax=Psychroserpens sp. TaxID=2020870 RepID=UPI003C76EDDE
MQLDHYSTSFNKQNFPITLICEQVSNAPNIGSLFRTADAFGIENLIFCGDAIPFGRHMTKTSRSTEKVVPHTIRKDALAVVLELKAKGYIVISLEITDKSIALTHFNFSTEAPIALVVGDENFGVSQPILDLSDAVIHIDMFGQNSSMNVVQAASITLYEITKQLK